MSNESNETLFYIELDALVDSRIGTLMRLKPEWAFKATAEHAFHHRMSDDLTGFLEGFDLDTFKKAYYERDRSTFFYSRATSMVSYLRSVIMDQAELKIAGDPRIGALRMIVNYYPYDLDLEDINYLRRVLSTTFSLPLNLVEFESRPHRDMTFSWLRAIRAAVMVIYNFNEWLNSASDRPTTVEMAKQMSGNPEMTLMAPGLLHRHDDLARLKAMDKSDAGDKDPFTTAKKAFASVFALEVLPARLFSVQQLTLERNKMTDFNKVKKDIGLMNTIAGRVQDNLPNSIIGQTEQIAEEFFETIVGLGEGLVGGDWDEFRNGLGDLVVVIWGQESVMDIPMGDDLEKIMAKNLTKFDTDYTVALQSLKSQQDMGYKCEIRETVVEGIPYYPIITTEDGFVVDANGKRKTYNKNKFLKSIFWSEEEFKQNQNLPTSDQTTKADLERLLNLTQSLSSRFGELGIALRDRIKSL